MMSFLSPFKKKPFHIIPSTLLIIILSAYSLPYAKNRTLDSFKKGTAQIPYDRDRQDFTPIVDSHVHFRPFGGKAIPFKKLLKSIRKTTVRFVNVYGIGQRVPVNSSCTYYLDCPGTPVLPTIKNDMANAENIILTKPEGVHLTLSMTFPDLANPETILGGMALLDKEYPDQFSWMGEVNLIKQALLNNHHEPASLEDIAQWKPFMDTLLARDIPINIHSDLGKNGSESDHTKFRHLMETVLDQYGNNKIIWAHMGLSRELTEMDPNKHIAIMKEFLEKYPKLMLDITWSVLEEAYFSKHRTLYTDFLNAYSTRFLPGTDFVASKKDVEYDPYKQELEINSQILKYLNDEAFRNIALGDNYFKLLNLDYEAPPIK